MISSREKKIISELIYHNGTFLLIKELATKLGVSSRTVHRELKNVRETLNVLNIELESEYRRGIRIDINPLERDALTKYIASNADKDLSEEEKKVALIYHLMINPEGIKKSALAVELGVSEHLLDELIHKLNTALSPFDLSIIKERSVGVQMIGNTLSKQDFLANMMIDELNSNSIYSVIENNFVFSSLINNKLLGILEIDNIFKVERLLMDELGVLPYQLTENAYLNLTLHIVLAIDRTLNTQTIDIKAATKAELKDTQEFEVSKALTEKIEEEFTAHFPETEIYFITMHLRGSRRKSQNELTEQSIEERTICFIDKVSEQLDYPFYAYPELKEGLILHIEPTLHRIESGIITANPLLDVIKEQYPILFQASGKAFQEVFGSNHLDESEIGFLTIHFGGILKSNPVFEVTTVCASGIGTSRILASQLRSKFQNISIKRELSISELNESVFDDHEIILSTVPLDIENYILVNPLLEDHDITKISEALSKHQKNQQLNAPEMIYKKQQEIDADKILQASELFHFQKIIDLNTETIDALDTVKTVVFENVNEDIEPIMKFLTERYQKTGFIIGKKGFSFPHVKSENIKKHQLFIVKNQAGIRDKNYLDETVNVTYQIILLVPQNTLINTLISNISVMLGEHYEDIETVIQNDTINTIIKNYIKESYRKDE